LLRSECYSSEYFLGCMDMNMLSPVTRSKAILFLNLLNNFSAK
jgi:hypothetical protein